MSCVPCWQWSCVCMCIWHACTCMHARQNRRCERNALRRAQRHGKQTGEQQEEPGARETAPRASWHQLLTTRARSCAGRAASAGQVLPKKEGAQGGPAQRDPGLVRPVRQGWDGHHRCGGPLGPHARAGLRAQEGTAACGKSVWRRPPAPEPARAWSDTT